MADKLLIEGKIDFRKHCPKCGCFARPLNHHIRETAFGDFYSGSVYECSPCQVQFAVMLPIWNCQIEENND